MREKIITVQDINKFTMKTFHLKEVAEINVLCNKEKGIDFQYYKLIQKK